MMKLSKKSIKYSIRSSSKDTSKKKSIINKSNSDSNRDVLILIKKLFQVKQKNFSELVDVLKTIYNSLHVSDSHFSHLQNISIPLNKSGRSGSFIGLLKNDQTSVKVKVIKFYAGKMNVSTGIKHDQCIKISNKFNEMLINLIIPNLDKIMFITADESKLIKTHTLRLYEYGISSIGTFITMPMIGIKYNSKLITNIRELLDENHTSLLKKAIEENNLDILSEYDKFITEKITRYFEVLRILQKYLNYINSDVKLTNVFIRETTGSNNNKKLKEYGFITNFDLILSDLEKSSIYINDMKITTIPNSKLKYLLYDLIGQGLIIDVRYGCDIKLSKCSKINIMDFDLLSLIIDLLVQFILIKNDIMNYFKGLSLYFSNQIGSNQFDKLHNILKDGKYEINKNYLYHITNIAKKLCN